MTGLDQQCALGGRSLTEITGGSVMPFDFRQECEPFGVIKAV